VSFCIQETRTQECYKGFVGETWQYNIPVLSDSICRGPIKLPQYTEKSPRGNSYEWALINIVLPVLIHATYGRATYSGKFPFLHSYFPVSHIDCFGLWHRTLGLGMYYLKTSLFLFPIPLAPTNLFVHFYLGCSAY